MEGRRRSRPQVSEGQGISARSDTPCGSRTGHEDYGGHEKGNAVGMEASASRVASLAAAGTLWLPKPTGQHRVGMTTLHVRDASRRDPWVGGAATRELMVSLWYPAARSAGRPAEYMTRAESELHLRNRGMVGLRPDALSTVRTTSDYDAAPAGRQRSLPLVVLSPGFTNSRGTLTALAEDLASHGYVVAAVDHTYESVATSFPDGRVATCIAGAAPHRGSEFWTKVVTGRASDVSFVLDELTNEHPVTPAAGLIDPSHMAMAGHSVGGAAAICLMLADSRVRAGIDMDGATYAPIPSQGLSRPFLFLGKPAADSPKKAGGTVASWEHDWTLLTGWKRWLVVAGAVHASFTDLGVFADEMGKDIGAGMSGLRSTDIVRTYTRAFFDQHLKGKKPALFSQPSSRYPEVTFILSSAEPHA
jgi:dienelactone hydrolase